MKKKIIAVLSVLSAKMAAAQSMFGSFAKDLQSEIESYFPIILAVVFIVAALFNMGKFFGEDRDWKKGITNIVLYVGAALLVMGAYSFLSRQKL